MLYLLSLIKKILKFMKEKTMRFDMVISFEKNAKEALSEVYAEVKEAFPDYQIEITPDRDISD